MLSQPFDPVAFKGHIKAHRDVYEQHYASLSGALQDVLAAADDDPRLRKLYDLFQDKL